MPREGNKIKIPLKTEEAIRLISQVKPTADMPRPGAAKKTKKQKRRSS